MTKEYPLISDQGVVGDLQTAALVASDGTVDWLRGFPVRLPSVFASILDAPLYDGIVGQAVFASLCVFLACLLLFTTGMVTRRFAATVIGATFGIAILYLVAWVLDVFGIELRFLSEPWPRPDCSRRWSGSTSSSSGSLHSCAASDGARRDVLAARV